MKVLADLATNLLKTNVKDVVVKYNGKNHIVRDVPLTHVVKHKSYVTKLENLSENWCNLKKARNQKKYSGSPIGRRLFGAAAAIAPQLSLHKLQFIIPLIISAHYQDAGLEITQKKYAQAYLVLTP